jgi:hypothetical protein
MIRVKNTLHNTQPIVLHCSGAATPRQLIDQLACSVPKIKYEVSKDLTFFTWSNKPEKTIFENQFDGFEIPYDVLGKDRQKWVNRFKLPLAVEFLASVKTKYVMAADAFDVLFLDNPQRILDHFIKCGKKLLFNASADNWPIVARHELPVIEGNVFRYLNSGVWIGETEFTMDFITDWKSVKHKVQEDYDAADDQVKSQIMTSDQVFLKHLAPSYPEVGLDTRCEIFQVYNKFSNPWVELENI